MPLSSETGTVNLEWFNLRNMYNKVSQKTAWSVLQAVQFSVYFFAFSLAEAMVNSCVAQKMGVDVVIMGAITIAVIPFQKVVRQTQPKTVFNEAIELPSNQCIDSKLIIGSLIFGMGWGVAGICPAPSFTLIGLGYYQVFVVFIVACLFVLGED